MNSKKFAFYFAFYSGFGLLIFAGGILVGSLLVYPDYLESQDMLYDLCTYTNKVSNLSNMQSETLAKIYERNLTEIPKLNYFNCTNVKGGF